MAGKHWARIDADYLTNPKVLAVGADGVLLHLASVLYLSAHEIDDGVLPTDAVRVVTMHAGIRRPEAVIAKLIEVGLWHVHPGGYLVHDYDVLNGDRSEAVAARRRKARQRDRDRLRSIDGGR